MNNDKWYIMVKDGAPKFLHADCVVYLKKTNETDSYRYRFAIWHDGQWTLNVADTDFKEIDYKTIDGSEIEAYQIICATNNFYDVDKHRDIRSEGDEDICMDFVELKENEKPICDKFLLTWRDGTHNPYEFGRFYDQPDPYHDWTYINMSFCEPRPEYFWPEKYKVFTPYKPIEKYDYPFYHWENYDGDYVMADIEDLVACVISDDYDSDVDYFIKERPIFAKQKEQLKNRVQRYDEKGY